MKKLHPLSLIGLSESEIIVYQTLVMYSSLLITALSRFSQIPRATLYTLIPPLIEKGIITRRDVGKRSYFSAVPPDHLRDTFELYRQDFDHTIDTLKALAYKETGTPVLSTYQGKGEIESLYLDIAASLQPAETYYRVSSRKRAEGEMKLTPARFDEILEKKEIQRYVITSEINLREKGVKLDRDMVAIPETYDPFDHNISKLIFRDRTVIIDYTTETAVSIHNARNAHFEKILFRTLYTLLKKRQEGR